MYFFDSNCSIGMRGIIFPGSFYKVEDLEERMNRYGIKKALVYHSMAREYNASIGNELLLDSIGERDFLLPVWVVMHHHTGEFPEPEMLADAMRHAGVKAVRLFPSESDQNFSIAQWNCGELLSMLEHYRIPVMLGMEQLDWNGLYDLLINHPELRIILTGLNYRVDRNLFALLEKFPNLLVETAGYKVHMGIENLCSRFGAQRLIFGSGMPFHSGGSAVFMIQYADITESQKHMIAYKNLESLLGGVLL